jgi:hypothetical protein
MILSDMTFWDFLNTGNNGVGCAFFVVIMSFLAVSLIFGIMDRKK